MQKITIGNTQVNIINSESGSRLVYGTRTGEWYAVGATDRDYSAGLTIAEFRELGEAGARARYLSPTLA